MENNPESEGSLADELNKLGQNLIHTLNAAWERPERQKLQQEIETGLSDLVQTLQKEADAFSQSPTGQQMKTDLNDLVQKVRSSEADTRLRSELINALKAVNTELKKAASHLKNSEVDSNSESPT